MNWEQCDLCYARSSTVFLNGTGGRFLFKNKTYTPQPKIESLGKSKTYGREVRHSVSKVLLIERQSDVFTTGR